MTEYPHTTINKPSPKANPHKMSPCPNCQSGMAEHIHCPKCGCTWDWKCDYGGWHTIEQAQPGCYKNCPNTTCN